MPSEPSGGSSTNFDSSDNVVAEGEGDFHFQEVNTPNGPTLTATAVVVDTTTGQELRLLAKGKAPNGYLEVDIKLQPIGG